MPHKSQEQLLKELKININNYNNITGPGYMYAQKLTEVFQELMCLFEGVTLISRIDGFDIMIFLLYLNFYIC